LALAHEATARGTHAINHILLPMTNIPANENKLNKLSEYTVLKNTEAGLKQNNVVAMRVWDGEHCNWRAMRCVSAAVSTKERFESSSAAQMRVSTAFS
jgi:hypothetical protein